MSDAERLLALAQERGALKYGDFLLSSGRRSSYYFDGRLVSLDPEGSYLIGRLLLPWVLEAGAEAVGGPAVAAVSVVTAVALSSYLNGSPVPAFFVRGEAKDHGMRQQIEGPLRPGSRVVIVDDACSTGGSIFHAVEAAESAGCAVVFVAALLDRHEGGSDELRRRGYRFASVLEGTPDTGVTIARNSGLRGTARL